MLVFLEPRMNYRKGGKRSCFLAGNGGDGGTDIRQRAVFATACGLIN